MKFINILKGPVSSVLGFLIMIGAVVSMGLGVVAVIWEGLALFGAGFLLLFMKDEIPAFIRKVFEKKIKE